MSITNDPRRGSTPATTTQDTRSTGPLAPRQGEVGREVNRTANRSYGSFSDDFFTKDGKTSKTERALGGLMGRFGNRTLAEGSFEKAKVAYARQGTYSGAGGRITGDYRVRAGELAVRGTGSVALRDGALVAQGKVQATASLIDARATGRAKLGGVEANGEASLFAGARAKADGTLTIDPKRGIYAAEVGGEAFAGVKAGVSGDVQLGKYGSVGGTAEAWAGVGAQFRAKVGYKDGKLQARVDIGAALGIGFKLGFNVSIDVKGIVNKAKEVIAKPVELIKDGFDKIKDIGKSIGDGLKKLKFW